MAQRMRLYDILTNRTSVNMLKILYDQEYVHKTAHTMPLFRLRSLLGGLNMDQVLKIESLGLVSAEKVEDVMIVSLNRKGKEFIEKLDELKIIVETEAKKEKSKAFKIEYDLGDIDQKMLVLCYKMQNETGGAVKLDDIAEEIYPRESSGRKGVVARYLNKMVKLQLMKKSVINGKSCYQVTDSGSKVIKNQLMESIV